MGFLGDCFQTVILQSVRLVDGTKNIRVIINALLDSWKKGAFGGLVSDSYDAVMGYLLISHGNKNVKQCHRIILSLVRCGKLREAVGFFFER